MDRLIASYTVSVGQGDTAPLTGTPGQATSGNPATNTPATVLPAYAFNAMQEELIAILAGAGITPDRTNNAQVVAAIKRLGQATVVLADTGAANAYTATNTPALVAGTWVDGVVQQVKIAHANTGASTYAPDGLTAIPIYGLGLQALQGGELPVGGTAVLMHATIAGVNGGNPICVLMECAGGAQQVANATQSQHAASLGQVQSMLLGAKSINQMAGNGTLTSANAGQLTVFTAASVVATLPAASAFAQGQAIHFFSTGSNCSVARAGADTINVNGTTVTSLALNGGDSLTLESNGSNGWYAVGGSAQLASAAVFGASIAGVSGYQKLPSGLIIQWGAVAVPSAENTDSTTTFPIAFPNACRSVVATDAATTTNNAVVWATNNINLSNFTAHWARSGLTLAGTNRNATYIAIGN